MGGDLSYGVGWIDEVGIRCVVRRDGGMIYWCHGFAVIAQWHEGIAARLALWGSLGRIRGYRHCGIARRDEGIAVASWYHSTR